MEVPLTAELFVIDRIVEGKVLVFNFVPSDDDHTSHQAPGNSGNPVVTQMALTVLV